MYLPVALLGSTGSGKSTLLNAILGEKIVITLTNDDNIHIKADGQPIDVDCDTLTINGKLHVKDDTTMDGKLVVGTGPSTTIDKNEIEEQKTTPLSIMPDGLLNNLSEEQIVTRRQPDNRSIKDDIAHLWAWQQRSIAQASTQQVRPLLQLRTSGGGIHIQKR